MSSSKHNKKSGAPDLGSWIFTIVMLFIFWPVGIFMLIGRLRDTARYGGTGTQQATPVSSKVQQPTAYQRAQQTTATAHSNAAAATATARQAGTQSGSAVRQTAPQGAAARPATSNAAKGYYGKNATQTTAEKAAARLKKEQNSAKGLSGLILFAAIIGLIAGVAGLIFALTNFALIASALNTFILGSFFTLGGIALLIVRSFIPKRVKLRRRYLAFLGERESMKITDFATTLSRTPERVINDLQAMIDDGYFGQTAYIDEALDMLVLNAGAADTLRTERAKPVTKDEEMSEYDRILRELRTVNDRIADPSISYKIERIEATCAKIFRTVEENPSKLPQIRRFMSYYLPTTLKLINSYATLEKQGIQGENIATTKESIDSVLSKLVAGFDAQLDQLFRADAMDIGADIEVLQSMMAQDGLTESGPLAQSVPGETTTGFTMMTSTGEVVR